MTRDLPAFVRPVPAARTRVRARGRLTLCIALGSAALVPLGCGQEDTPAAKIEDAARRAEAYAAAMSSPGVDPALRERRFKVVREQTRGLSPDAPAQLTGAAGLLSARSGAVIAAVRQGEAGQAQRAALSAADDVLDALGVYARASDSAAALEAYDPQPATRELGAQVRDKDKEIADAIAAKRALEQDLQRLQGDADAAAARASQERAAEAQIRASAERLGAQASLAPITQANERRRAADAHDREAADLRAQAALIGPQIERADLEVARLERQRRLIDETAQQLLDRASTNRERASGLREQAQEASQTLSAAIDALVKSLEAAQQPAEDAEQGYTTAASEARRGAQGASREGREAAMLASATYLVDAATVAGARARTLAIGAGVLEAAAQAEPAISARSQAQAAAQDARERAEAARVAATEHLTQARDAFTGLNASESVRERVDAISQSLERLVAGDIPPAASIALGARTGDTALQTGGPARKAPAPGTGDPEAEIRAAIAALPELLGSGDVSAMERVLILPDGPIKQVFEATKALDAATQAKFGVSLSEAARQSGGAGLGGLGGMGGGGDLSAMLPALDTIPITVLGPDSATVTVPLMGSSAEMPLRKVDGAWRVDLAGWKQMAPMLQMMGPMMQPAIAEIQRITADVEAGRITDPAAVVRALEEANARMSPGGGG